VREVVGGLDAPLVTCSRVWGVHDAVGHGVAHGGVGGFHVDFQSEGD